MPSEELYEVAQEYAQENGLDVIWHAVGVYESNISEPEIRVINSQDSDSTGEHLYQLHVPEDGDNRANQVESMIETVAREQR